MAVRETSAGSGPADRGDASGEDGFTLLEAVISIALLSIIMAALTTFSITTINSTGYQRQRQAAVQVANSTLDTLRAVQSSTLANGRTAAAVQSQFNAAPTQVAPWLTTMTQLSDGSGATSPQIPMSASTTLNNTVFTATNYLGTCTASGTAVTDNACTTTVPSNPVTYTRAVVAVTWPGPRCPNSLCSLVTATLISPRSDPLFSSQQQPPTAPTITDPGSQISWLGQTVSVQFATDPGSGVDPETWSATGLPAGLSISPSGLVTGQPTALGSSTVTVKVVDAFLRSSTRAVTWRVVNPLSGLTNPFTTTAGATITAQPLAWSCAGNSCTYTLSGAPGGIGLSLSSTGSPQSSVTVSAATGTMYLVGSTTAAAAAAAGDYAAAVKATNATDYWTLGERTGTTGTDSVGSNPLVHGAGVTVGAPGALLATADAGATYSGADPGYSVSTVATKGPQTFSESLWFSTTTTRGGKLLGFGNSTGATSGQYDRHIYMDNGGHLVFGVYNGGTKTVATTGVYNDGKWHQVVGTLSPTAGLTLYVDGAPVAAEPTYTTAETNNGGYWHIGGDNLSGWPSAPSSNFFAGSIDEVSINSTALSTAQVAALYRAGTATPYTPSIAAAATNTSTSPGTTSNGPATTAAWTVNPPPSVAALDRNATPTASAPATNQVLTYSCPSASCILAITQIPSGMGLSTSPTGSPTSSVTVTSTSGYVYVLGTPTAANAPTASSYPNTVGGQNPSDYWRLGERSGTSGSEDGQAANSNTLAHGSGVTVGTAGAIASNADSSATFDGTVNGASATTTAIAAPAFFTQSLWFRTTATNGGLLMDFGNQQTGGSPQKDRMLYLDNAGHVTFGVYPGAYQTLTSAGTYNDGAWHQVVATLGNSAMTLYLDGARVARNTNVTSAENNASGYWHLGGDNLYGWPNQGDNPYFTGSIDEVAVYSRALSATQVAAQWSSGRAVQTFAGSPNVTPTDTTTSVVGNDTTGGMVVRAPSTVGGLTATVKALSGGNPGDQVITYGCPSSSCTITLTGAPAGVGLTTTATGTPASTGTSVVTVTGTTGAVYLRGPISSSAPAGTYTLVLTPADATTFAAGTAANATWTVGSPPTVAGVAGTLVTKQGAPITSQRLTWTCPSSSCTFGVTGAPTGIGLNTADSGTPGSSITVSTASGTMYLRGTVSTSATTGSYSVAVVPTDIPTGQNGTSSSGTWTVAPGPTASGLTTPFAVTAGGAVANQSVAYTCPSGTCTLALAGAPSGIGLYTATSGGTSAASLTVTAATGIVYLRGTVPSNATTGPYSVTVTPTDTTSPAVTGPANTAAWTVNAPPSVSGLSGSNRATKNQGVTYGPLTYSCPSGSCTLAVTSGAAAGLGVAPDASATAPSPSITVTKTSGQYWLRGQVTGTVGTTYTITVTPTDTTGNVAGATNSVSLAVDQPTISALTQNVATTQNLKVTSQQLTYFCPSQSCSIILSGAPTGIGLNTTDSGTPATTLSVNASSGTVYLRGTTDIAADPGTYSLSVAVVDTLSNTPGPSQTAGWTVTAAPTITGLPGPSYTVNRNTNVVGTLNYTCPTASCTFSVIGAPTTMGLTLTNSGNGAASVNVSNTSGTLYFRGNTGTTAKTYNVVITPTDRTTTATGPTDSFNLVVQ